MTDTNKATPRLVVRHTRPLSNPVLRFEQSADAPMEQHTVAKCYDQDEAERLADAWNAYDHLHRVEKLAGELVALIGRSNWQKVTERYEVKVLDLVTECKARELQAVIGETNHDGHIEGNGS